MKFTQKGVRFTLFSDEFDTRSGILLRNRPAMALASRLLVPVAAVLNQKLVMKKLLITCLSATTIAITSTHGQGFMNLDFEAAKVVFPTNNVGIAVTNALPGWLAYFGTNKLSSIEYNLHTVVPPVELFGSNSLVLSGNFSVQLTGLGSITQTGVLPADAQSLLFKATASSPTVSLGGNDLSLTTISNALNSHGLPYTVYGADISPFAGLTETLVFSQTSFLDDIQFSSMPVPEPGGLALVALGSAIFVWLCGRRASVKTTTLGSPKKPGLPIHFGGTAAAKSCAARSDLSNQL